MSISQVSAQAGSSKTNGVTSASLAFSSNVALGNLVVVCANKALNSGAQDTFVAGDCTQSAGTAVLGDLRMHTEIAFNAVEGWVHSAVWTAVVTTAGSCTMQVAGLASAGTVFIGLDEYSTTVDWAEDATREEDVASAGVATNNSNIGSGNATSAGEALFIGTCMSIAAGAVTGTIDSAFTLLGEDETQGYLGYGYKIVTSGNTDEIFWTLGNNLGSSASLAVIKEALDPLLADDVESASEVSSPAIGQVHAITADDVESASEVSSPAVGQAHALTADDVESQSEVSAPALGQSYVLTADDVESASEVSAPALGQVHALTADDVESQSEAGVPALGQIHVLTASDSESQSELSKPALVEAGSGIDTLLADDVESASEVSSPALAQVHVLTADDVESRSEVSQPRLDYEPPASARSAMRLTLGGMGMGA